MTFDLQDWMERRYYFSGVLYQNEVEQVLSNLLRRGDTFVDVGANIGVMTMIGAARIGPSGRVVSIEPNPDVCDRLRHHVGLNSLEERVWVVEAALGERAGTAALAVQGRHPGGGTLTGAPGASRNVRVQKGDDLLREVDPARPVVLKIDVEGFEKKALDGLQSVLTRSEIALVIELTDKFLRRVGDSVSGIYTMLSDNGFAGYQIVEKSNRFVRWPALIPSSSPEPHWQYDALFVKPQSAVARRIKRLIN